MKKISKIFIFLVIMMGLFLMSEVYAAQIDFDQKVKDMKDYLAPDSIYIYMKQEVGTKGGKTVYKEWETTLTENNPNSNSSMSTCYTDMSFITGKPIEIFVITPIGETGHTYYDFKIEMTNATTGSIATVEDLLNDKVNADDTKLDEARIDSMQNYLAFHYKITISKTPIFGCQFNLLCALNRTLNNECVDFKLPLFIHIEESVSEYYNTDYLYDVDWILGHDEDTSDSNPSIEKGFKNADTTGFKDSVWVSLHQTDGLYWGYHFHPGNTYGRDVNNDASEEFRGYTTSGKKFRTGEELEVMIVAHMPDTSYKRTEDNQAFRIGIDPYQLYEPTLDADGYVDNWDLENTKILRTSVNFGNHYIAVHLKTKIKENAGDIDGQILLRIGMYNKLSNINNAGKEASYKVLGVNFVLPIAVYVEKVSKKTEYLNENNQLNIFNELETIKGQLADGTIWIKLKQGNKECEYLFSKEKNTAFDNINSKGFDYADQGFTTGGVVFNANEDIEVILATGQTRFDVPTYYYIDDGYREGTHGHDRIGTGYLRDVVAYSYPTAVFNENNGNVNCIVDENYKFSAAHYKIKVRDNGDNNSTAFLRFWISNGYDVGVSLPLHISLYDKTRSQINIWEELFSVYNSGNYKIDAINGERKTSENAHPGANCYAGQNHSRIGGTSYKQVYDHSVKIEEKYNLNANGNIVYFKIKQGDLEWSTNINFDVIRGAETILKTKLKHLYEYKAYVPGGGRLSSKMGSAHLRLMRLVGPRLIQNYI